MRSIRVLSLLFLAACSYRPPRFTGAAPIVEVADDAAIAVPRKLEPLDAVVISDDYLRRPILRALDPERIPASADVNALDDVPRSSWFWPGQPSKLRPIALPLAPSTDKPIATKDGKVVTDARGSRFEIIREPLERKGLGRGAAIASRLLRELGYRASEVSVLDLEGDARAALVRWPEGIDLGPTPEVDRRKDDPNDRVDHADRRTLRALRLAFFWLGIDRVDPSVLRDVYAGKPGEGHVEHYVVDLSAALGANAALTAGGEIPDDEAAVTNLFTLGLKTRRPPPVQTEWLAIGDYAPDADPGTFRLKPPFEPADRMLPEDAYWIAKRIGAVKKSVIDEAIDAARIDDAATRGRILTVLLARQRAIEASAYAGVTPCEVEKISARELVLTDRSSPKSARYVVQPMDVDGSARGPARIFTGEGDRLRIPLDAPSPYTVIQVRSESRRRAMEVHLVWSRTGPRVIGLRH